MYARNVSIHLKPNMLSDYTQTFEKDVLPLLRKQNGFRDEIAFSDPAEQMSLQSACGTTKPMQRLTTTISTQTW
jgi:hypothetical protein